MIISDHTAEQVRIGAPAKINLFLEVINKRPDGYHNINSLFQAVSLFDRLTCTRQDRHRIELTISGETELSAGSDNLVVKAWELMAETFDITDGLQVKLEKNIPIAAGLAGGSSDAAAIILACNILYDLGLSRMEMAELGLKIGSDLPFFFSSGQALVTGRGERITETDFPTDYRLLLVNPGFTLSTAAGYAALKRDLTKSKDPFSLACCRAVESYVHLLGRTGNDFESVCLEAHPELVEIRDELLQRGAALARMSGSGPTMFGIFTDFPVGKDKVNMRRGSWRIYAVAPITLPWQVTK